MNKPNRYENGLFLPPDLAMQRYNMSRRSILKISDNAKATVRIGRMARINVEKVDEYLNSCII